MATRDRAARSRTRSGQRGRTTQRRGPPDAQAQDPLARRQYAPAVDGVEQRVIKISGTGAGSVGRELERLSIKHSIQSSQPDLTVTAEPAALGQIIHNLLINAMQALQEVRPSERTLTLTLSSIKPHTAQLSIQDTGLGIENDVVAHIFKPFFTTRPGTLGLGLSLCEKLAGSMGGNLTAYNRVPRGAKFCLNLQLAP